MSDTPLNKLDRLVHEPARLTLLMTLAVVEEADFVYLQRHTGLTAGNIASHAARLEEAGYLAVNKGSGGPRRRTVYRLTGAGAAALASYRRAMASLLGL